MVSTPTAARVTAANLPGDVIIDIITHLKQRDNRRRTQTIFNTYETFQAGLVACTHVCRSWRSVALGCSRLWVDIDAVRWDIEQIRAFLHRSNGARLNIYFPLCLQNKRIPPSPPGYENDPDIEVYERYRQELDEYEEWMDDPKIPTTIMLCFQNIKRASGISICILGRPKWVLHFINRLFTIDAPFLSCFQLDALTRNCMCRTGPLCLDGHLFGNDTPMLRRVWLRGVIIPGDSSIFRDLSSLVMRHVLISGRQSILEVLQHSPSLSDVVVDSVRCVSAGDPDGNHRLFLPSLNRATVCGPPQLCTSFIKAWRIPSETRMSVLCTRSDDAFASDTNPSFRIDEHVRAFVSIATDHMTMEIQSLDINQEDPPSFALTKRRNSYLENLNHFWGFNQLSTRLGMAESPVKRLDLYIRCLLLVHGATPWKTMFANLRHLESLTMHFDTCSTKAVMENSFTYLLSQPTPSGDLWLPSLRELVIVIRRPLSERIARLVGRCLESRTRHDPRWRLESLRIECYVESKLLQEFEDCPCTMLNLRSHLESHVERIHCSWSDDATLQNPDESSLNIQVFKTGYRPEYCLARRWWIFDNWMQ